MKNEELQWNLRQLRKAIDRVARASGPESTLRILEIYTKQLSEYVQIKNLSQRDAISPALENVSTQPESTSV